MKTYNKICLFCRKEFEAQKRTTKYCSHTCNSRAYKAKKRNQLDLKVSFEDFVKNQLQHQSEILYEIQVSISELLRMQKIGYQEFISAKDYCEIKKISRKTLSNLIKNNQVDFKKISARKYFIKI